MRALLAALLLSTGLLAFTMIDKPIDFGPRRIQLTQQYILRHYGLRVDDISIVPKMVVVHYTAIESLEGSYAAFKPETLPGHRRDIAGASSLNVSAHFLVDRDGTVYRLMHETFMARHVIGLNYHAIGIENVGTRLTPAQLKANVELIRYLLKHYPTIRYLIGHYEYRRFEKSPLWMERDPTYRTRKHDPGEGFMKALRAHFPQLKGTP
ncbi:N-acetylmuramoyl-L-alanine amidase [Hydrogenimonas sp.]